MEAHVRVAPAERVVSYGGMLAAPLWTAAAFVAQPRHHQPVPALRHRVARPVAVSVDDAMPIIAFGVGSLAAAAWALNGRPTGLTSPTPGAPAPTAPLSVPEPELLTPEGQRLCQMLASRPAEFSDSWSALLRSMGDTSNAPGSSLQARVAEVQRREDSRRVLVDALGLAVAHTFAEERLVLLPSAAAISPGASLPPEALCPLTRSPMVDPVVTDDGRVEVPRMWHCETKL